MPAAFYSAPNDIGHGVICDQTIALTRRSDGGARLPFVEDDRLGIEDPPAIAHLRIDRSYW
jgi:hypothetical protein